MKRVYLLLTLAGTIIAVILAWSLVPTSLTNRQDGDEPGTYSATTKWKVLSDGVGELFEEIQFLTETYGWGRTSHSLWRTDDGGQSWIEIRRTPKIKVLGSERNEFLGGFQFLDRLEGWMIEGGYLLHTKDGGVTWVKHEFKHVVIRSFRFLDKNNGWFVGGQMRLPRDESEVETWRGVVYTTRDGGMTWHDVPIGIASTYSKDYNWHLLDVWPASLNKIWAVGDVILHSDDGGKTWKDVDIEKRVGVYGKTVHVQFIDSNTGWITTNQPGGYLVTNDGGKTWESREAPADTSGFADLVYVSSTEAWGVARGIYHSSDSGKTWTKVLEGDYFRIEYLKDQNIVFAAGKAIAKYKRP